MPVYQVFLDFTNGYTIGTDKFYSLVAAIQFADYQYDLSGKAFNVSVHSNGKCYYSTDITVKHDGFPD